MKAPRLSLLLCSLSLTLSAPAAESFADLLAKAKSGDAADQTRVGYAYLQGVLVRQDLGMAVQWFRLAAEKGNVAAQGMLGAALLHGNGVTRDPVEGIKWTRKAAEQGDRGAQYNLGSLYYQGSGVPRDIGEAISWFEKSAKQGVIKAQHDLAFLYSGHTKGLEGMRDVIQSYAWMRVAANAGDPDAGKFAPLIEAEMTAAEKAEGQKLAQEIIRQLPK